MEHQRRTCIAGVSIYGGGIGKLSIRGARVDATLDVPANRSVVTHSWCDRGFARDYWRDRALRAIVAVIGTWHAIIGVIGTRTRSLPGSEEGTRFWCDRGAPRSRALGAQTQPDNTNIARSLALYLRIYAVADAGQARHTADEGCHYYQSSVATELRHSLGDPWSS